MIIDGTNYNVIDIYDLSITVSDSFVVNENKTCSGHGEAKLYMGAKDHMRKFYANDANSAGFNANCIVLKKDLLLYMKTIHHEYQYPSIKYRGQGAKKNMEHLWKQRNIFIEGLPEVLKFQIKDQDQIEGNRGYVKTIGNAISGGYGAIRMLSLPFVSYLSVMKIQDDLTGDLLFYWKLFTDFSQMAEQQYIAKNYGKKKKNPLRNIRDGQIRYRQGLFSQFGHCPFSKIDDLKLLIASHIKPYSVCNQKEKVDLHNGLMLSPLFDKLFDRGYISFKNDGTLMISDWLSSTNQEKINFNYDIDDLRLTEERKSYLEFHRDYVFKY